MTSLYNITDNFAPVNNIRLHYVEYGSEGPVLILLHGLTANAHAFDGLIPGLIDRYRVICPDLRGNGLSDKPNTGYNVEDHVKDILGLISHLGEEKVYLGGHSFGGYLAFYIAAHYPQVINRIVILDAAKAMNPNTPKMLAAAISRLDATYSDFDDYLAKVKKAAYINFWDPAMLSYYRADVQDLPGGGVKPRCNLYVVTQKSLALGKVNWPELIGRITVPTMLVNGLDNYTLGEPLLPVDIAKATVAMMKDAKYAGVAGNHLTMLYGLGSVETVIAIRAFLPVHALAG